MDTALLSHNLFIDDNSGSSRQPEHSRFDQAMINTDTTQPDPASYVSRESDDCTNHRLSSLGLLETRDPDESLHHSSEVDYGRHDSTAPSLPFYLRRTTLLLFLAIFALMIAILEILFVLSVQEFGLSAGTPWMRYLWSYGTTGILTVTAAFWHRLDYEAKVAAPWFKANQVASSKKSLTIDYIDAWSLLVPFKSFRNRDYEVACSSSVSLLLQAVIALSTALFAITPTNWVNNTEPIVYTSRFVDDPMRLNQTESFLPYYIATVSERPNETTNFGNPWNGDLTYPEGYTNHFAYQTFDSVSTSLIDVHATVDGLTLDLACETASVGTRLKMPRREYIPGTPCTTFVGGVPYFEVNYQGCQTTIDWDIFTYNPEDDIWSQNNTTFREHGMMLQSVPGFSRNRCNSTDKNSHRVVFLSVEVKWLSTHQTIINEDGENLDGVTMDVVNFDAKILRANALTCSPHLENILLNVSRSSAGVQNVSPLEEKPADLLRAIHPWDFVDFFFKYIFVSGNVEKVAISNTTVWADVKALTILDFCGQACQGTQDILDESFLQSILAKFLSAYAAATAQYVYFFD
ncbi:hypothetical protein BJ166DRAFT_490731 [Pestalotiopsis sp. NC0098]|nr:hypothetical protein BJ166DRAFT_490731 [Pestalotiopsis sp. NC0098]